MTSPKLVRGILLGGEFDKLVVQATPDQVAAFSTIGSQVAVAHLSTGGAGTPYDFMSDRFLYDRFGRMVAEVVHVQQYMDRFNVSTYGSSVQSHVGGLMRVDIRAVGLR